MKELPLNRLERFVLALNPLLRAAGKQEIRFIDLEERIALYEMGTMIDGTVFLPEKLVPQFTDWLENNQERYGCKNPRVRPDLRAARFATDSRTSSEESQQSSTPTR